MKDLTEREQDFFRKFLKYNGCGAETPAQLLEDNYSCQCLEELYLLFDDMTPNVIGGFLSSLQNKGYLWVEDRDGPICKAKIGSVKEMNFEPDLYWVSDSILEDLPQEMRF